ncbi:MAG: hypothetical protein EON92_19995 [Burkholderiales bacterium]|nr:MAG: hypothetical protein EON92_19995 [Burkholderiales bacterium]
MVWKESERQILEAAGQRPVKLAQRLPDRPDRPGLIAILMPSGTHAARQATGADDPRWLPHHTRRVKSEPFSSESAAGQPGAPAFPGDPRSPTSAAAAFFTRF